MLIVGCSFAGGTMEEIHHIRKVESVAKRGHRIGDPARYVRHRTMFIGVESSSGCMASSRQISR